MTSDPKEVNRTDHHSLSIKYLIALPFPIISSGAVTNDKYFFPAGSITDVDQCGKG